MSLKNVKWLAILALVMSLVLVACGGNAEQQIEDAAQHVEDAAEELQPTLEAAIEEVQPTVEAAIE
jgi:hypothetical protein